MAAIVWPAENHTLSFSQQEMCAKEGVIPRNPDDVCIPLSLETEISFHKPLMKFLSNKGCHLVNAETLQHSLDSQKGASIHNSLSTDGSEHASTTASSMQNNELCQLEPLYSPKTSQITFVDSFFDSEAQNSSRNHLCKIPPCLLQKTHKHSEPSPSFTLKQTDHCIGEEYALFQTGIGRPLLSFDTKSQSEHIMRPARELNVERYFSALQGPELDVLKEREESLLPINKEWPFLLRFPIGCFSICLGLTSQAMLWKTLSTAHSMQFMHIPKHIILIIWCSALMAFLTVSTTYTLKCLFYFEAVRREFFHPVRINFFFAPWIACMLLTLGIPPEVRTTIHPILWVFFMGPLFALELKIYGQWLSGGRRSLSKVANPSTHLSLVGNFIGALLAATIGWMEVAIFFWVVGFAHYLVLFVTLYQKLPTATVLDKELHPVFFLFVATPSTASIAWSQIAGHFDLISRFAYFLSLFLYLSLVVRVNFFRGFRFSVTWWAYTYPMTAFASATLHYSLEVEHPLTQGLAVMLSVISSAVVLLLCIFTVLHLYWGSMFPNDVAIAITDQNYHTKQKIKVLKGCKPCQDSQGDSSHGKSKTRKEEKSSTANV